MDIDFAGTNYDDIKRVFSIWVLMNMDENCMDYVHLTDEKLVGSHPWKGGLDLLNIVLIGISSEPPGHDGEHELHRLLSVLLSAELPADEKLGIMEREYGIPLDDGMRKDVSEMCNLSQGIWEKGLAEGIEKGVEKGRTEGVEKIILNMHSKGYTPAQIADVVERSVSEVETSIRERESVLA